MKVILLIAVLLNFGQPTQTVAPLLAKEFTTMEECKNIEAQILSVASKFDQYPLHKLGTKCIEVHPEGHQEADTTPTS
jgi:hypothetical protein